MKNVMRVSIFVVVFAILGAVLGPVASQEDGELVDVGAGNGGVIVTGNAGGSDPATFNPLISSDVSSSEVIQWLYPAIININYQTGLEEPSIPGGMAESWEYDDTGTVLTIHLRDDLQWNDGTPITAADYLYAADAIRSGEIDSPRSGVFATMADGTPAGGKIASITAPDPYTVEITFTEPDCIAFTDVNDITPVPAHVFNELYGTDYALMMDDPRAIPTVTWGPFKDVEYAPGERISELADQSYPDTVLGYVAPSEWVYLNIPDENVETERFIAGDLAILAVPSVRQNDFRTDPALQQFPRYEFTGNSFVFMALNNADPASPQPGVDADGNIIPQTPHPVLGDVRVRQAIGKAVDINAIIEGIRDGNGIPVATHTIPTSWVYNADLQYEFDPETAGELLTDAGWVDDDQNPDTPRICQGCLYAREVNPDFEGSPLTLKIHVPSGGVVGEQMGEYVASALDDVGFETDFQAIDWSTAFLPELDGQTFDVNMLSWSLGLPVDPDVSAFYTATVDVPESGFNFVSYYNADLEQILAEARNPALTNGCDLETRREMYLQAQEILFNEMPYLYMYVPESMTVVQSNLANWRPTAYSRTWDTDAWALLSSDLE